MRDDRNNAHSMRLSLAAGGDHSCGQRATSSTRRPIAADLDSRTNALPGYRQRLLDGRNGQATMWEQPVSKRAPAGLSAARIELAAAPMPVELSVEE
jgi:hypothetical protein